MSAREWPMARAIAGHDPESYRKQPRSIGVGARLPVRDVGSGQPTRVHSDRSHRLLPWRRIVREVSREGRRHIVYELSCGHHVLRWRASSGETPCRQCGKERKS